MLDPEGVYVWKFTSEISNLLVRDLEATPALPILAAEGENVPEK